MSAPAVSADLVKFCPFCRAEAPEHLGNSQFQCAACKLKFGVYWARLRGTVRRKK